MISRTLIIRRNNRLSTIKKFAKLMNIKNYFLCEDSGSDAIDFSFHEKRESWFCYSTYDSVDDGFHYFIDINIYLDYNEFFLLLILPQKSRQFKKKSNSFQNSQPQALSSTIFSYLSLLTFKLSK